LRQTKFAKQSKMGEPVNRRIDEGFSKRPQRYSIFLKKTNYTSRVFFDWRGGGGLRGGVLPPSAGFFDHRGREVKGGFAAFGGFF
jgi:hypothetical protein